MKLPITFEKPNHLAGARPPSWRHHSQHPLDQRADPAPSSQQPFAAFHQLLVLPRTADETRGQEANQGGGDGIQETAPFQRTRPSVSIGSRASPSSRPVMRQVMQSPWGCPRVVLMLPKHHAHPKLGRDAARSKLGTRSPRLSRLRWKQYGLGRPAISFQQLSLAWLMSLISRSVSDSLGRTCERLFSLQRCRSILSCFHHFPLEQPGQHDGLRETKFKSYALWSESCPFRRHCRPGRLTCGHSPWFHLTSFGRNGGHDNRRPDRGDGCGAHQDGFRLPQ